MTIKYNVETDEHGTTIIWYEANNYCISFTNDPTNSDYQAYLATLSPNSSKGVGGTSE